jgi:hypothetical protein
VILTDVLVAVPPNEGRSSNTRETYAMGKLGHRAVCCKKSRMPKATAKTNAVNNTNQLGNALPPDFR